MLFSWVMFKRDLDQHLEFLNNKKKATFDSL